VSEVWWNGEKLMAKPIPLEDFYQPAPTVQEPVAWIRGSGLEMLKLENGGHATVYASEGMSNHSQPLYTTPPAAQRQWVGLTDEEITELEETTTCLANESWLRNLTRAIEAKLKEKNT
jgi:hypothetical protein